MKSRALNKGTPSIPLLQRKSAPREDCLCWMSLICDLADGQNGVCGKEGEWKYIRSDQLRVGVGVTIPMHLCIGNHFHDLETFSVDLAVITGWRVMRWLSCVPIRGRHDRIVNQSRQITGCQTKMAVLRP